MVILTVRADVDIVMKINAIYSYGGCSHKLLLFLGVVD